MITLHFKYKYRINREGAGDLKLPGVSGSDVKKKKSLTINFRAHNVKARIVLLNQG
jgi:hypothetical protein